VLARLVRAAARQAGFGISRTSADPAVRLRDIPEADREIICAVKPHTATSAERVASLIAATRYIVRSGTPGDVVECGVWKGGA
jgi:hypothetical protein